MSVLLIFGGTTEGRELACFCSEKNIPVTVSVTTEYGAGLLPDNITVLTGKLDEKGIAELLAKNIYCTVIDATHPYAKEATKNIRAACDALKIPYLRLIRDSSEVSGETVKDISEMIELLNKNDDIILSTLGSKSLSELMKITNCRERLYVRVLPSEAEKITEISCEHVIAAKGPFSTEQNVSDIRRTNAAVLLTKDSGAVGGYPEKIKAAEICGIRIITLLRPKENGLTLDEIRELILNEKRCS